MQVSGRWLRGLAAAWLFGVSGVGALAAEGLHGDDAIASADTRQMAHWVLATGDNAGRSFAIVDKKGARLHVFGPQGAVLGITPALIGEAVGDDTAPGVGDKPPSQVLPHERTTPAGRFVSEPGRNLGGEQVVWVEYDSGFAIHRVRPGPGRDRRMQKLASRSPADHRDSLGCVVVDPAFFDSVVMPAMGHGRAVVYVLPETRSVSSVFGAGYQVVLNQPAR